jgi:hypothetical protein
MEDAEGLDAVAPLPRTRSILKRAESNGSAVSGSNGGGGGGSGAPPTSRTVSWNDAALEAVREFERR